MRESHREAEEDIFKGGDMQRGRDKYKIQRDRYIKTEGDRQREREGEREKGIYWERK